MLIAFGRWWEASADLWLGVRLHAVTLPQLRISLRILPT